MTTQADKDALIARLTKIQSVGGSLLSNATQAKALALAIDVTDAPAPDPTPDPTPTPEPDPTPTPEPTPQPSGAFPDATNTGVPAGVVLKPYTGPATITKAGTVIDGADITVPLVIAAGADNVTIRNSRIRAEGYWLVLNDAGAKNLVIEDVELDGKGNANGDAAVAGRNYTLTRVNIHGTVDGLKLGSNVTVQDSWIHDLVITADSHNDGCQNLGGTGITIRHNSIVLKDGATSAILLSTGSGEQKNILIEHNLLGGGAFTVYGGYEAGRDVLSRVSNIVIRDNEITTQVFPRGGAYGPFTSVDSPVVMSGNVWHDGPKAGQPVS